MDHFSKERLRNMLSEDLEMKDDIRMIDLYVRMSHLLPSVGVILGIRRFINLDIEFVNRPGDKREDERSGCKRREAVIREEVIREEVIREEVIREAVVREEKGL